MKNNQNAHRIPLGIAVWLACLLAACGTADTPSVASPEAVLSPSPIPPSTGTSTATPVPPKIEPEPTATPRTLTICLGAEPDTLFVYGGMMHVKSNVLEAIYDGPIDSVGYGYQPVILEKLPSLADGDARIEPVVVTARDRVFNDAGEVVPLAVGEVVRPYGCTRPGCAVAWDGGPLEMAQLSADFTLREGLRWSDGEPLTARDSIFGYSVARGCRESDGCGFFTSPLPMGFQTLERTAASSTRSMPSTSFFPSPNTGCWGSNHANCWIGMKLPGHPWVGVHT